MNITSALYAFASNQLVIKEPFEIQKETNKCYWTKNARYLKSEIGRPILKSPTIYPYIELVMIDANEETLRMEMSRWFTDKACEIQEFYNNLTEV